MTAEQVTSITHTPLIDPDAPYCAERTIQFISGQSSGDRCFAYTNAFAEDSSETNQTAMVVMQISLTREGVASSYKMGGRLR